MYLIIIWTLQAIEINLLFKMIFSAEWYKGVLTDEELEALERPTPKPKPKPSQNIKRQKNRSTTREDFARNLETTQLPQ